MRLITIIRLLISVVATPFVAILYLNIEKWAESHGYDLLLVNAVEGQMPDAVKQLAFHPTTLIFAIVICSIVAGIWIDVVLRRLMDKITFIRPNIPTSFHLKFRHGNHNAFQLANGKDRKTTRLNSSH